MKIGFLIPILLLFVWGCEKAKNDIVITPYEKSVDTLSRLFPENASVILHNPSLFSDTVQKNIVLTKESNVYVTFLDEQTNKINALCWYSYNNLTPPLKVEEIQGHVLFPKLLRKSKGGELEPGFTLQLGTAKFPAGTVIGFFLISDGGQDSIIDYSKSTHYTNYNLNYKGNQQHILFKMGYFDYIVIGFEDNTTSTVNGEDFNDLLFSVSDNITDSTSTAFDLAKVVIIK